MRGKDKGSKELSGRDYFCLGLLCFGGLMFDMFAMGIDWLIFRNKSIMEFWYVKAFHSIEVALLWIALIMIMVVWIKRKGVMEELLNLTFNSKTWLYLAIAFIGGIMMTFFEGMVDKPLGALQIIHEYTRFIERYGDNALIVSITQNIYYIAEVGLVVMLLAFMQRAGEKWFGERMIPYGGVGLMLTWGLGHLTKGIVAGLWITGFAFIAGGIFTLNKKSVWATYLFIILVFIL